MMKKETHMKWRTAFVLIVIIALIIYIGLNFRPIPPGGKATPQGDTQTTSAESETEAAERVLWLKGLDKADVTSIVISQPEPERQTNLILRDGVWRLAGDSSPLADYTKVTTLLDDLFSAPVATQPAAAVSPDAPAEQFWNGPTIRVATESDSAEIAIISFSPADYSHNLVKAPDSETVWKIKADLLGDIGIWGVDNPSETRPNFWLKKNVFTFDSAKLANIDFESPGQDISLAVDEEGKWHNAGTWPLTQFATIDAGALQRWIDDLATLRITDAVGQDLYFELNFDNPTHMIRLGLEEGEIASLAGLRADDGKYYVELSSQPGQIYALPEWRFNLYFRRIADVFPELLPSFNTEEARFIDIRRDGLSIKLVRRASDWLAGDFPHPLREGAVKHWLEALAYWRPLDSFNPQNAPAIPFGAPTVEISLDGDSKRFRLGESDVARNVSYVEVAPLVVFSATASDAKIMFPYLEDVFDFSQTTPGMEALARQVAATIEQNSASFTITSGSPVDDDGDSEQETPPADAPVQELPESDEQEPDQEVISTDQPLEAQIDTLTPDEVETPEEEIADEITGQDVEKEADTESELMKIFEEPVPADEVPPVDEPAREEDAIANELKSEDPAVAPDLPAVEEIPVEESGSESTPDEPSSEQKDETEL